MVARLETLPVDAAAEAAATTRALFEQHGRMVLAICRSLLRNAAEAEDAAQDTFLSAHRSLLAGHGPRKPHAWLATIARNECRARLRSAQPMVEYVESEDPGPDQDAVAAERAVVDELKAAISDLPPRQRESVVLREFYGLSPREVAAAMDLATPVVDALLFRARRRLRQQLTALREAGAIAVTLQQAVREALERAIPGFEASSGVATTGTVGAGVAGAKLASLPIAAKVAAAAIGVAAVGSAGPQHTAPASVQPVRAAPAPANAAPSASDHAAPAVERSREGSAELVEHRSRGTEDGRRHGGHSGPGGGGPVAARDDSGSHSGRSGSSSSGPSGSDSSGPSGSSSSLASGGSGSSGPSGSSSSLTSDGSGSSGSGSGESPSSGPGSGGDDGPEETD
jgi:RNA polymerase sigma-70 factor (ECF subfamily)